MLSVANMTASEIMTLISLISGAIFALFIQAIGLIMYWNRAMDALRKDFADQLLAQRTAHDIEMEKMHGRVNNIRKEFVLGEQYQRDLGELKQGHREIIAAIERSAEIMRARVREGEAMDIRLDERTKRLEGVMDRRQVGPGE